MDGKVFGSCGNHWTMAGNRKGKAKTSEDSRKMLDIEYARTHTFWGDIKILIKTPLAALQQENV